ncbi:MAG: hypothetical protein IKR05_06420, partial [Prevotella sp.]|nr:hypothetical protein [Prevotella sp.]
GHKPFIYKCLCPYRATMNILTPKALPWAMCLQAFQAALRIQADNHFRELANFFEVRLAMNTKP